MWYHGELEKLKKSLLQHQIQKCQRLKIKPIIFWNRLDSVVMRNLIICFRVEILYGRDQI